MKKILVVVDCQNDFITGPLGTQEARAIVPNVVDKINEYRPYLGKDCFIYATMDTHSENYLSTQEGKNLPVEHCINKTHGWQLHADIAAALEDLNVNYHLKRTFASFALACDISDATGLREDVEIELVGLCTDICVVSNALLLKSNFPEARIIVDATCCAGVTPQTHEAALETMRMCQISVINWKE